MFSFHGTMVQARPAQPGHLEPDRWSPSEAVDNPPARPPNPRMPLRRRESTAERRSAIMGGIPHPDDDPEVHEEFTRQVKLEPFQKALDDLQPEVWISGIRREETEFRKSLDILSYDNRGILKVAPFFYLSEEDVQDYMDEYELPSCRHYFDPTKVEDGRECGLHTSA